jgi:hypothetical protein
LPAKEPAEPFERLVDGLRLNELRSAVQLPEFVVEEATELSGGERVLLLLEGTDGAQIAGSMLPRGEDAGALQTAIKLALRTCAALAMRALRTAPRRGRSTSARGSSRR